MYKKILIPVDLAHPERAPEMIQAAKKLADEDSVFVLANIIHAIPASAEMAVPQEYFDRAESEATDKLKAMSDENDLNAQILMRIGHPANDILKIQEDEGIDMTIIGSHRPGFQDYFLGSTAARVVRHSQCPVFVMR